MADEQFISVVTSDYAPINPNKTEVPLNGHFEITVRKVEPGNFTDSADISAKTAATITLSNLSGGSFPLFGSSAEVKEFANSLIMSSSQWSKSYDGGSDGISFIYQGKAHTLPADFVLSCYSDAFNSTAEYTGKAEITVTSKGFLQQFDDAFEDRYTIELKQAYAPDIVSFAPKEIQPTQPGSMEYIVDFGQNVQLEWRVEGDSLKSPTLTLNDGVPETVSFNATVEKKISAPAVYRLYVESNAYSGVCSSRTISFGIQTPPRILLFQAAQAFCLKGSEVRLDIKTAAAVTSTITADNSTEPIIELPASASYAMVHPEPKPDGGPRVGYTLTVSGFKEKNPAYNTAKTSITVSRWEKAARQPSPGPIFADYDTTVRVFLFGKQYFCFAGMTLQQSLDGVNWTSVSPLALPDGASPTVFSAALYDDKLYIVGGSHEGLLCLNHYDFRTKGWSNCRNFGPLDKAAGGALVFIEEDKLYYAEGKEKTVYIYNYSPPPFDNWGKVGLLPVPAKVKAVDSACINHILYFAVSCDDNIIYLYKTTPDLEEGPPLPLKIKAESSWVRIIEAGGLILIMCAAGSFDIRTGTQRDMMFEPSPKLFGVMGTHVTGIAQDGSMWIMND